MIFQDVKPGIVFEYGTNSLDNSTKPILWLKLERQEAINLDTWSLPRTSYWMDRQHKEVTIVGTLKLEKTP